MSTLADLFGRTFVINLPERRDRLAAINRQLDNVGMGFNRSTVKLHPATRCSEVGGFPSTAVRGCFLSHLAVLREARAEGLRTVLIMEDDLAISPLFASSCARLMQEAEDHPWGFIYFGHG